MSSDLGVVGVASSSVRGYGDFFLPVFASASLSTEERSNLSGVGALVLSSFRVISSFAYFFIRLTVLPEIEMKFVNQFLAPSAWEPDLYLIFGANVPQMAQIPSR